MNKYIQDVLFQQVKDEGEFYGIEANEVTNISNWEKLGLVIRYLHNGEPTEKLIEYIEIEVCTGAAICSAIVEALRNLGLDVKMCTCCAQTYNGTGGTWSEVRMVALKASRKFSPRVFYCSSTVQAMNLILSGFISCFQSHGNSQHGLCPQIDWHFFKYSPTQQRKFEKSIVAI